MGRTCLVTVAFAIAVASGATPAAAGGAEGVIAFQTNDGQPGGNCCVLASMRSDGANRHNLLPGYVWSYDPAWSPDGSQLAFAGWYQRKNFAFDVGVLSPVPVRGRDSHVMRDVTWLTRSGSRDTSPAWAPDGRRIAFLSSRSGNRDIWIMNADGSGQHNLTSDRANDCGCGQRYRVFAQPTWSPDGSRIAFTSDRDEYGNLEIYVMNADGSNVVRVTNSPGVDAEPDWSPDGRSIAFNSDRIGNEDIYVQSAPTDRAGPLDPPAAEPVRLTRSSGNDTQPDWSESGTRIAFTSDRGGISDIYVMNSDGTEQHNVTRTPDIFEERPDWRPKP